MRALELLTSLFATRGDPGETAVGERPAPGRVGEAVAVAAGGAGPLPPKPRAEDRAFVTVLLRALESWHA
jgi:hypothetical protein